MAIGGSAAAEKTLGGLASALSTVTRLANDAASAITAPFKVLRTAIGSIETQITSFVRLASPGTIVRFQLAVDRLMASIGRILIPVLEGFIGIINKMADAVASLSPQSRQLISSLAAASVAFAGVGASVAAMTAIISSSFGGIPTIIGAVTGAMAGLAVASGAVGRITEKLDPLFRTLVKAFDMLAEAMVPVLDAMTSTLGVALDALVNQIRAIAPVFAELGQIFAQNVAMFAPLIGNVVEVIGQAVKNFGIISLGVMNLSRPLTSVINSLGRALGALSITIGKIVELIANLGSVLAEKLAEILMVVAEAVEQLAIALIKMLESVNAVLDKINSQFRVQFEDRGALDKAGAPARPAQIGDLNSFVNRAYASAFSMGAGSPEEQTAKNTAEIARISAESARLLNEMVTSQKTIADKAGIVKQEHVENAGNSGFLFGKMLVQSIVGK